MVIAGIVLFLLFFFFVLPSVLFFIVLFRHQMEKTAASSNLHGTYYAPWADEMIAAEEKLNTDPNRQHVTMKARDGAALQGDLFANGQERLIIMCHGYMTAPTKNFAVTAERFMKAGYDVLMIHQRAHGPSGGKHTALGLLERYDTLDWAAFCANELGYERIVLYGVSMGAASIAFASGEIRQKEVKALIMDCGFASPMAQLKVQASKWHIPDFMILPLLQPIVKAFMHVDLCDSSIPSMEKAALPAVFLHGMKDSTVRPSQGKENFEHYGAEKIFIPVEEAEHTLSMIAGGEPVFEQVRAFLERFV